MFKYWLFCAIIFNCFAKNYAQTGFLFKNPEKEKISIPFQLIGNLMVVKVKLNRIPMSFIVDTGANHTFLFNLTQQDSLELKSVKRVMINGLGSTKAVSSIRSDHNILELGELINTDQNIHLLLDKGINFSSQLGVPIHGILGSKIFSNYIVKINYINHRLTLYKSIDKLSKRLKRYDTLPLISYKNRFFINAKIKIEEDAERYGNTTFLLDTGSSESVWLFKNENRNIGVPEKSFRDFMGTGIGGDIHGSRARLTSLKLGKFELKETKLAFPDSTDVALVYKDQSRHGNLGSEILKRFHIVFNTAAKEMYLKKNRLFKKAFEYNMSGIQIQHNGVRVTKTFDPNIKFSEESDNSRQVYSIHSMFKTALVPVFEIVQVRANSPAAEAGIQEGDILLSINKKPTYNYKLSEILEILSNKNGKQIKLRVERNQKELGFEFELKRLL